MSRGQIPVTISTRNGVTLPAETNGDATNNHYVTNSGKTKVHVRNSGAGARWVMFKVYRQIDGQSVTAAQKSIAAGETKVFGPYPTEDYGTQLLIDVEHAELKLRAVE